MIMKSGVYDSIIDIYQLMDYSLIRENIIYVWYNEGDGDIYFFN